MEKTLSARKWLVQTALSYLGTPYIWGGDDPSGFDCSGFVLECLKSVGLVADRTDFSADQLMTTLNAVRIDEPTEGALLFSLASSGKATHVVICLDSWFQIGASGGTSAIIDTPGAWRAKAYVKIRPIRLQPGRFRILLPKY
jgi:peptidoglycan endopeptidase LytE